MKVKGSQDPCKQVAFSEVTDPRDVPAFDHSLKWTQIQERRPRRKLPLGGMQEDDQSLSGIIRANSKGAAGFTGIQRQRSNENDGMMLKKPRVDNGSGEMDNE